MAKTCVWDGDVCDVLLKLTVITDVCQNIHHPRLEKGDDRISTSISLKDGIDEFAAFGLSNCFIVNHNSFILAIARKFQTAVFVMYSDISKRMIIQF